MKRFTRKEPTICQRIISGFIAFTFIFTSVLPPNVSAQVLPKVLNLPAPGVMVSQTPIFMPTILKGIQVNPENPLNFTFFVHKGDTSPDEAQLRAESDRLIKYFLATLTTPSSDLWVNLSPYEKDQIITDSFGMTEMGRDLLAQDYVLKQLTASLMYPEDELGKKFWKRVHEKAYERFGTTDIPVDTFNKIWIVPERAAVYEHEGRAFVVNSKLKVMLAQDYLALQESIGRSAHGERQVGPEDRAKGALVSDIIRDVLIPEIEKEVNEGETFANLRQVFHSMILATWFKNNLKETLLGQVYVNQNKIAGVDVDDPAIKQKIYDQYLKAFKLGVYNYIKEEYDPATQKVMPRQYFSGGAGFEQIDRAVLAETYDARSIRFASPEIIEGAKSIAEDTDLAMLNVDLYENNGANQTIIEGIVQQSLVSDIEVAQRGSAARQVLADAAQLSAKPVDLYIGANPAAKQAGSVSLRDTHGYIVNDRSLQILQRVAGLTESLNELMMERNRSRLERARTGEKLSYPDPEDYIQGTDIQWKDAWSGNFRTSPVEEDYLDRRSELTGPATIKPTPQFDPNKGIELDDFLASNLKKDFGTIAYQLLSGAKTMMFDGEDALGSKFTMSLDNIQAIAIAFDALDNEDNPYHDLFWQAAESSFKKMVAKGYYDESFDWRRALLEVDTKRMFRHRGPHLKSREFKFLNSQGQLEGVSATIADIVFYVTNVYQTLGRQGSSIKLYSPKLQTAAEAAWLKKVINAVEDELGLRRGTVKTTVLIEQIQEVYEIEGIRAALGENFAGFNTGRWDYIADVVQQMYGVKDWIAPNFTQMHMGFPFMANYEGDVLKAVNLPGRIIARDELQVFTNLSDSQIDELIKKGYFRNAGTSDDVIPVRLLEVQDQLLKIKDRQRMRVAGLTPEQKELLFQAFTVHWIGGMEANIPTVREDLEYPGYADGKISSEEAARIAQGQIATAQEGKRGEMRRGAGGFWMAHWLMGKPLTETINEFYSQPGMEGRVNQLGMQVDPIEHDAVSAERLIELAPTTIRTKDEFRKLISIMVYNLNAELTGRAAVASKSADDFLKPEVGWLMDDRATTEGRAKLVRDWVKKQAPFTDANGVETGEKASEELFLKILSEEFEKLRQASGKIVFEESKNNELIVAGHIARRFVTNDDALPLPWTVDLVNVALDFDKPEDAIAQVDNYIEVFNRSNGMERLVDNPQFEVAEVLASKKSLPEDVMRTLRGTADQMVTATGGVFAADESTGTAGKRLAVVGLENNQENREQMRRLIVGKAKELKANGIDSMIVYKEFFDYTDEDGRGLVEILKEAGITVVLKTDNGLSTIGLKDEARGTPAPQIPVEDSIANLKELLATYGKFASATKWRVTIPIDTKRDLPKDAQIRRSAQVLGESSRLTQEAGLVPMLEPEVLLDGPHSIDESYAATTRTLRIVYEEAGKAGVWLPGSVLKTSMILSGNKARNRADAEQVGYMTVKGLLKEVPADVSSIVFLSGGQGDREVNENMDAVARAARDRFNEIQVAVIEELVAEGREERAMQVAQLSSIPWPISFSFGRGLQAKFLDAWKRQLEGDTAADPQAALVQTAAEVQAGRVGRLAEFDANGKVDLASLADDVEAVYDGLTKVNVVAQRASTDETADVGYTSFSAFQEEGVNGALAGHSTARKNGDTLTSVRAQFLRAHELQLKTRMLAVGEPLNIRNKGEHKQFVERQIRSAFRGVSASDAALSKVAYEPIWAINTGVTASSEDAQEMAVFIRGLLTEMYDSSTAGRVRILYGGSVKPSNAEELIEQTDIDGFLIGGASNDLTSIRGITETVKEYAKSNTNGRTPVVGMNHKTKSFADGDQSLLDIEFFDEIAEYLIEGIEANPNADVEIDIMPTDVKVGKLVSAIKKSIKSAVVRGDLAILSDVVKERLAVTAKNMVSSIGGVFAADESTGTAGKRLAVVGLENTQDNREKMRQLIVTKAKELKANGIDSMIVYKEFFQYTDGKGKLLVDYLEDAGIVVVLKTDNGLDNIGEKDEERGTPAPQLPVNNSIPNLLKLLNDYGRFAQATKWRVTIPIDTARDLPQDDQIRGSAQVLAESSRKTQQAGLVPMLEPEVLLDGPHSIEESYEATTRTLRIVYEQAGKAKVWFPGSVLKTSMILSGNKNANRADADTVGYMTVKGLLKEVPADVAAIVFLSGGQGDREVNENMDAVTRAAQYRFDKIQAEVVAELRAEGRDERADEVAALTETPWPISFSFGRGLQAKFLEAWKQVLDGSQEESFAQDALIKTAKEVQAGRVGRLAEFDIEGELDFALLAEDEASVIAGQIQAIDRKLGALEALGLEFSLEFGSRAALLEQRQQLSLRLSVVDAAMVVDVENDQRISSIQEWIAADATNRRRNQVITYNFTSTELFGYPEEALAKVAAAYNEVADQLGDAQIVAVFRSAIIHQARRVLKELEAEGVLPKDAITLAVQSIRTNVPGQGDFEGGFSNLDGLQDYDVRAVILGAEFYRSTTSVERDRGAYVRVNELDGQINQKLIRVIRNGNLPILSVGERLSDREAGQTFEAIAKSLQDRLAGVSGQALLESNLILMYQPSWPVAFEGSREVSAETISAVIEFLREWIRENKGEEAAENIRIVYGAETTAADGAELIANANVDGGYVTIADSAMLSPEADRIAAAKVREWMESDRFRLVKDRLWTADEIAKARSKSEPLPVVDNRMPRALIEVMRRDQANGTFTATGGVMNGPSAANLAEAGIPALYFSGWQASHHGGEPDLAKYPFTEVPQRMEEINKYLRNKDADSWQRFDAIKDELEIVFKDLFKSVRELGDLANVQVFEIQDEYVERFVQAVLKQEPTTEIFIDEFRSDPVKALTPIFSEAVKAAFAQKEITSQEQRDVIRTAAYSALADYLVNYLIPFYADGDTGHQSIKEMVRAFVKAGAGGIHIEDQAHGCKKCGHMAGKVLVSTEEQHKRLLEARKEADSLGSELLIIARTDAQAAKLLQSKADPSDHYFIKGSTNADLPSLASVIRLVRLTEVNAQAREEVEALRAAFPALAEGVEKVWGLQGLQEGFLLIGENFQTVNGKLIGSAQDIWDNRERYEFGEMDINLDTILTSTDKDVVLTVREILDRKPARLTEQMDAVGDLADAWGSLSRAKTLPQLVEERLLESGNEQALEAWRTWVNPLEHSRSIDEMRAKAEELIGETIYFNEDAAVTFEGFYQLEAKARDSVTGLEYGVLNSAKRSIKMAGIADVIWMEQGTPNVKQGEEFINTVKSNPRGKDILFAINLSPSFNWSNPSAWSDQLSEQEIDLINSALARPTFDWADADTWGGTVDEKKAVQKMYIAQSGFSKAMGDLGFVFQFVTIFQDHVSTHAMWEKAKRLKEGGAGGFVHYVQQPEQMAKSRFVKHQTAAGTKRVGREDDPVMRGASNTGARGSDSTENQFGGAAKKADKAILAERSNRITANSNALTQAEELLAALEAGRITPQEAGTTEAQLRNKIAGLTNAIARDAAMLSKQPTNAQAIELREKREAMQLNVTVQAAAKLTRNGLRGALQTALDIASQDKTPRAIRKELGQFFTSLSGSAGRSEFTEVRDQLLKAEGVITDAEKKLMKNAIKDVADAMAKDIFEAAVKQIGGIMMVRVSEGFGRDEVQNSFKSNEVLVPNLIQHEVKAINDAIERGDEFYYSETTSRFYPIVDVMLDVIEGTNQFVTNAQNVSLNETPSNLSGATSVIVMGRGVRDLGNAPDGYVHHFITNLGKDAEKFRSATVKVGTREYLLSDPELYAVHPKDGIMAYLEFLATSRGQSISEVEEEIVIMDRDREQYLIDAIAEINETYGIPGVSVVQKGVKDGTVNHAVRAILPADMFKSATGQDMGTHKTVITIAGSAEGFMSVALAGMAASEGAVAGLRIYNTNLNKNAQGETMKDLSERYNFGKAESADIRNLRESYGDAEAILRGKKLFTDQDVKGDVRGVISFISNDWVFGQREVQSADGVESVNVLTVEKVDGQLAARVTTHNSTAAEDVTEIETDEAMTGELAVDIAEQVLAQTNYIGRTDMAFARYYTANVEATRVAFVRILKEIDGKPLDYWITTEDGRRITRKSSITREVNIESFADIDQNNGLEMMAHVTLVRAGLTEPLVKQAAVDEEDSDVSDRAEVLPGEDPGPMLSEFPVDGQGDLTRPDQAMKAPDTKGGIDLNPELLDLQIRRDGNGVPLPVYQQPINLPQEINGFIPVILDVTPVFNMPMILGLADDFDESTEYGSGYQHQSDQPKARLRDEDQVDQLSMLR